MQQKEGLQFLICELDALDVEVPHVAPVRGGDDGCKGGAKFLDRLAVVRIPRVALY